MEITTFGTVGVRVEDRDIPALSGTKLGLLLTYVAAESPRRIPREELARLFWPDLDADSARVNLRQGLFQLRRQLPAGDPPLLDTTPRYVRFQPQPESRIDFLTLNRARAERRTAESRETTAASAERARAERRTAERRTAESRAATATHPNLAIVCDYRGHFLEGLRALQDLPELSAWAQAQRDHHWQNLLVFITHNLVALAKPNEGEPLLAELHRLLAMEPHDETLHHLLMKALAASGHPKRALDHYAHLEAEAGKAPGELLARTREEILGAERAEATSQRVKAEEAEPAILRPERRRVTVVACHVQPDAEADIEIQQQQVNRALEHVDFVLLSHHGHVVPSPGHGLLAYFGYPAGREEATVDAVHAAWQALETAPADCKLRLAVDSDLIVTGADPDLPDPTGQLTARVHDCAQQADPGTLRVSAPTYARVSGYFSFRATDDGTGAYRVTGDPGPLDRVDAQSLRDLTPLTGRSQELQQLRGHWDQVLETSEVRFVLVQGEAGLGKSRLARGLDQQVRGQARSRYLLKCREDRTRQLLAPVRQAFATWMGQDSLREARQRRLEGALKVAGTPPKLAPRLAHWLTHPEADGPESLAHEGLDRDRIIDTLVELVHRRSAHGPTLLICDDLHWMDSGTSEFLRRLYQRLHHRPIMAILTARMSFRSSWRDLSLEHIRLHGLDDAAAHGLVDRLDPNGRLSSGLRDQLVERGEGVPLFLEELTRYALEAARTGQLPETLPPGLSNLLVARLEQLGSARELAHSAAVIGRDFDTRILSRLRGQPADTIRRQLTRLTGKGFIEPAGMVDGVRYRFRHVLFRQAAYESMLLSDRTRLHGQLADLMQEDGEHGMQTADWGRIANHLYHAGRYPEAVNAWLQAGEAAFARGILPEASHYFEDALDCLERHPEAHASGDLATHERDTLRALGGVGASNLALLGYGSRTVNDIFERAMRLTAPEQDPVQYFRVLWGLWHGAGSWHGFQEAHRLAAEMEQLAERSGDRLLRIAAHYVQGNTHFWTGRFAEALEHQTRAVKLYRDADHATLVARHTENPAISARGFMAWTLLHLGNHARAWTEMDAACQQADQLGHRPTEAFVYAFRSVLGFYSSDPESALPAARHALSIAREYDYPLWRAAGITLESWALARQGQADAYQAIEQQVEAMRHIMDGVNTIFQLILLDALETSDIAAEQRLAIADEALTGCRKRGDLAFEPAIRRLRAVALLASSKGKADDGWQDLESARSIAHEQGNPNIERQALLDYARFASDPQVQSWAERELLRINHCIIPRPHPDEPRQRDPRLA
ncbi:MULTISPECIES: AAA family ATPase [unclassified Thioalkalivibrio]|uniref:AAA family ATPase n=1 Tax=unclassified Thioalkalivibrio TaxID=2621013 RepID=UPI000361EF64|nr:MULTISPECIES: AAA family ATPase [unclassified Thioalkalivibrio]